MHFGKLWCNEASWAYASPIVQGEMIKEGVGLGPKSSFKRGSKRRYSGGRLGGRGQIGRRRRARR